MLDPRSKEFEDKFRARYEALHPAIDAARLPGERIWLDRVASWEDFVTHGANASATIGDLAGVYPELAALVLEAFPSSYAQGAVDAAD